MTRQFQHLGSGGVPTGRVYKMNTVVYAVIPNHIDIFGSTACIGNDAFGGLESGIGRVANPHSEARNCNRVRGILGFTNSRTIAHDCLSPTHLHNVAERINRRSGKAAGGKACVKKGIAGVVPIRVMVPRQASARASNSIEGLGIHVQRNTGHQKSKYYRNNVFHGSCCVCFSLYIESLHVIPIAKIHIFFKQYLLLRKKIGTQSHST